MKFNPIDAQFMRRALALARRGTGQTSPNPVVGAVLVRAGQVIGEGWHKQAGGSHAEIFALTGRKTRGATQYVTLEPCSTHGRTPPCTDAIIAAGIRRVVVAATDPNPLHSGRGYRQLRRAGIRVETGLLAKAAADLNAAFNHWITTRRPLVIAKAAVSLDGKVATRTGDSQWITSAVARQEAHKLRAGVDAIMVGAGTVRADDPRLTLRHGVRGRQPWRVVVDARGRCQRTARLFTDSLRHRTIVCTTALSPVAWRRGLALRGTTVLVLPVTAGQVDLPAALAELGRMEITGVLIEGGSELLGSLFDAGLVDRVVFFFAPKIIGGRAAKLAVAGVGTPTLSAAWNVTGQWRRIGRAEMMFEGWTSR